MQGMRVSQIDLYVGDYCTPAPSRTNQFSVIEEVWSQHLLSKKEPAVALGMGTHSSQH